MFDICNRPYLNECNASIIKEAEYRYRIIIRLEYHNIELLGNSPEFCISRAHQELWKQRKLLGEVSICG